MQEGLRHRGRTALLVGVALLVALVAAISLAAGAPASDGPAGSAPALQPVQSQAPQDEAPQGRDRDCPRERGSGSEGSQGSKGSGQGTAYLAL
jgi:hypothetical protein